MDWIQHISDNFKFLWQGIAIVKRSIATSMIEFLCNKIITHNFCFHFRRKMQHTSEVLTITQTYMCLSYAFYKRNFLQHNHMLSLSISLLRKYSYSVVLFVLFSLSLSLSLSREREKFSINFWKPQLYCCSCTFQDRLCSFLLFKKRLEIPILFSLNNLSFYGSYFAWIEIFSS